MNKQHPLTEEQLKSVVAKSEEFGTRTQCMFVLFASHGMRSTELAQIKLSDINLRDRTVHVRRLKGSISKVEAMSAREIQVLESWLTERATHPNAASELLFPSHRSHRNSTRHADALDRSHIYNIFRKVLETAGMPSTSRGSHAVRHSIAQISAEKGVPIKMLAQMMGHKNINSTAQYYEHRQSEVDEMRARVLGL
jgi:type 1 fimbriae regulatory protein FimB